MAASKYGRLEAEVRELLEDGLGKFLADLTDGSGEHQPSIVLTQQLSQAFASYYDLKAKLDKNTLDCAVLALTKSGKSTILNAFCGASLLPSNNVPETARIVALEHCSLKEEQQPVLSYKVDGETIRIEGEEQIRTRLEILNRSVRGRQHSKEDEQILTVRTELAALQTEPQDLRIGLRLLDTPGPNEAGEDALRHSVERLLDSVDSVVYILDYTKLKTQEEADLLSKLSKSNPQLVMRLAQRLFFVVNKVDVMHTSEGLQEDELREYVAEIVTKQMNLTSFQLRPEQVLLVSAEDALLSRLILSGKATARQRERFARKQFGRNAKAKHTEAEYLAGARSLLEESHLLDLEQQMLGYLYNHAGSLKIVSLLDGIAKLLTKMKNAAVTAEAATKVSSATLSTEINNLQTSLATTSSEFQAVQKQASEVESDVIDNVQQRMSTLKDRLFLHIAQVLDPSTPPPQPASPTASQHKSWYNIWAKGANFLSRNKAQESNSDAALRAKLSDLHSDIKRQIETEITEFWHELETATNQTYQELIGVINQHLLELARKIEGSVGKVLDLCLRPLDICLHRPSAEEFHCSIQDLLKRGIKHGTRREIKHREESHTEWQKRYRGICNHSEYYVGIPTTRRVAYHEDIKVFSLDPDSIKEHFKQMVDSAIAVSINNVRDYVHDFMTDQIKLAHAKISSYSALYADAMTAALTATTLSAFEQNANIIALRNNIGAIEGLLTQANKIAQAANELFPQLDLDSFDWQTDSEIDYPPAQASILTEKVSSASISSVTPEISAPCSSGDTMKAASSTECMPVAAKQQEFEDLPQACSATHYRRYSNTSSEDSSSDNDDDSNLWRDRQEDDTEDSEGPDSEDPDSQDDSEEAYTDDIEQSDSDTTDYSEEHSWTDTTDEDQAESSGSESPDSSCDDEDVSESESESDTEILDSGLDLTTGSLLQTLSLSVNEPPAAIKYPPIADTAIGVAAPSLSYTELLCPAANGTFQDEQAPAPRSIATENTALPASEEEVIAALVASSSRVLQAIKGDSLPVSVPVQTVPDSKLPTFSIEDNTTTGSDGKDKVSYATASEHDSSDWECVSETEAQSP